MEAARTCWSNRAGEFDPFRVETLTALHRGQVCARAIAGGQTGEPFLGETFGDEG
jgi:hypothetical protein